MRIANRNIEKRNKNEKKEEEEEAEKRGKLPRLGIASFLLHYTMSRTIPLESRRICLTISISASHE